MREQIAGTLSNFPAAHAEIVIEAILWAEMTGKSMQGIIKLTGTEPIQDVVPRGEIEVRVRKCAATVEGNANPSPVSSSIGMREAIRLADMHGIGVAGINGIYSSNMTQSHYLYQIAEAGYVGFMCSRSPAVQTGFGSIDPHFGTNPYRLYETHSNDLIRGDYQVVFVWNWSGFIMTDAWIYQPNFMTPAISGVRFPEKCHLYKDMHTYPVVGLGGNSVVTVGREQEHSWKYDSVEEYVDRTKSMPDFPDGFTPFEEY
ncbi:MAG: Ldh family oxidoreductase [Candidatus Dormibacteraceae bacterium]